MAVEAIIDHKLRVRVPDLPHGAARDITQALSIPNVVKEHQRKHKIWGWQQLPDTIDLWSVEGDMLVMPRGFAHDLATGLVAYGEILDLDDLTTYPRLLQIGEEAEPRPHQIPAVEAILANRQGIYKAPAGSGKTVSVLLAIREASTKSLVIVNTKNIVTQWIDRTEQFLGPDYPVGQIGDGIFEVSEYLTIATAQTLHRRFDAIEREGFFDEFGFVCLDECHHATAETYNMIMDRFSARYRIGVSATPDKTGDFALATNVLGPIFHETKAADLRDQNILVRPTVVKMQTDFRFGFRGARGYGQRSNYPELINRLVADEERNEAIVETIMGNQGHVNLILSKRLEHLDILAGMLEDAGFVGPVLMMTGRDKNDHRKMVEETALAGPCAIFSTIADEAVDIPTIDRLYLVFPQRNAGLITQQVGRCERQHPDKKDAVVYDFADTKVTALNAQWRVRRFEVYEPRGLKIVNASVEDVHAT